jgi:hypothetical protein
MNPPTSELQPEQESRKVWVKPRLQRLQAGSAEFQQTNGTDNFQAVS